MEIEEQWKEVFGEPMSPQILTRILKIQKAMNLRDDDGILQILIPLEFYLRLYEQFPASARKESEVILNQIKSASAEVLRETTKNIDLVVIDAKKQIAEESEKAKTSMARALDATIPRKIDEAVKEVVEKIEKKKSNFLESVLVFVSGIAAAGGIGAMCWWAGAKGFFSSFFN